MLFLGLKSTTLTPHPTVSRSSRAAHLESHDGRFVAATNIIFPNNACPDTGELCITRLHNLLYNSPLLSNIAVNLFCELFPISFNE